MPKFPIRGLLSLVALLAIASQTPANDDLDQAYIKARSQFHTVQALETIYIAKKELSTQLQDLQRYRGEVEATVRNLKIIVDSLPQRKNNIQMQVVQSWLAARTEFTEVERQIEATKAQITQVEESVDSYAASTGTKPLPRYRRDVLTSYPEALRECSNAFRELKKEMESAATEQGASGDALLKQTNAALNRTDNIDAQFGPPASFYRAYSSYLKGTQTFQLPRSSGRRRSR